MDVIAALIAAAERTLASEPVQFAYLFGSHARDEARRDSDVDIAVRFSDDVAADEYLARSTTLAGIIAQQARLGPINGLVVLNDAPLRLIGRILRDRVVLYSSDEQARVAFEVQMRAQALDFELHAAPLDQALLETMAAEQA